MKAGRSPRRWGFRTRLAVLIASVFTLAGVALLTVQYILVHQLLNTGIANLTTACSPSFVGSSQSSPCPVPTAATADMPTGTLTIGDATQRTVMLSQQVLSGLLVWSIVVLVVFTGLAMLAGWWLSKRSLGRIAQITATTRSLDRDDLHRRLDLPGPDDEIKELGDTIDGMLDRLDEAFTRQDRFIASASHELRTPLTTARTALEIPLAQGRVPADIEPAVRRALGANERSEQLIAALLLLARQSHPGGQRNGDASDLHLLAQHLVDERQDEARSRGIRISLTGADAPLTRVDRTLAEIAIGNLIDNAVRHGTAGGEVTITISSTAVTAVVLRIVNAGSELPYDDVEHLIEPFNRGATTRLAGGGLGLGLTIVDTIARASGGSLALTPRGGGGLIADLTLPTAQEAQRSPV